MKQYNNRAATVATLLEAGEVERFHAVPSIPAQTVAAHSWGVAIIAMQIYGQETAVALRPLMEACLLHDTGELITGDIPFTAKRGVFADIRPQLDAAEAAAMDQHLWPMPRLEKGEQTILKLADMLEGLRYATLYERSPFSVGPVIPDRWWHALNGIFRSDAMDSMTPIQCERAYSLFAVLSPAMHAHRVYTSFEALRKTIQKTI
jgi:5'-deoxynucleotidase YfbR-like HD superfamily hydrolase